MKIEEAGQKVVLYNLFYEVVGHTSLGEPVVKPRQFHIEKLLEASSVCKKLLVGVTREGTMLRFAEGEVSFTPNEVALLKGLFDENSDRWDISSAEAVLSLDALFKGKKPKATKVDEA